jgi:hypothetical protein
MKDQRKKQRKRTLTGERTRVEGREIDDPRLEEIIRKIGKTERERYRPFLKERSTTLLEERVGKIRSLPPLELEKLLQEGGLKRYLGIHPAPVRGRTQGKSTLNYYLVAAGKREIRGTIVDDCLKLIEEGKTKEVMENRRKYQPVLSMLSRAGIMNRETGKFDKEGVRKSRKENRILYKGEW